MEGDRPVPATPENITQTTHWVNYAEASGGTEPLPALPRGRFEVCKQTLLAEGIHDIMAVSLQTREHNFGVLLFPHAERHMFGSSNLRLLIGLALQIALTLENYVITHEAHRRTKEYELLTEIGQAISSHLDQDDVLRTVQVELGKSFDTSCFYIAFQEEDEIRFELEVEGGVLLPKILGGSSEVHPAGDRQGGTGPILRLSRQSDGLCRSAQTYPTPRLAE